MGECHQWVEQVYKGQGESCAENYVHLLSSSSSVVSTFHFVFLQTNSLSLSELMILSLPHTTSVPSA
jgi:hypothetical protein